MLRTDKQVGPTCFAQALFNAGMIGQDALEDYQARSKAGDLALMKDQFEKGVKALPVVREMMQRFGFPPRYFGVGVAYDRSLDKYQTGSKAFIIDWLERWLPHAIKQWQKLPDTPHELTGIALGNRGKRLVPKKGRGIAFVMEFEKGPLGLIPHGHAIAYEDGMVSDSNGSHPEELETWEEYVLRTNASLVALLPDEDKHDDFSSNEFWWDYDPSLIQLRQWMM